MKAEQLKAWVQAETREIYPGTEARDKVASVIQVLFREGYILEALMWTIMVLIIKGKGEYRSIGSVETIWKVCRSIVNIWI